MRDIPIEVLLSFPTPNYVDPVTRGPALLITNIVFIVLVVLFVTLRIYTRIRLKRWFGIDDWFIILAFIFTIGMNSAVILANRKYYWDRHVWDIPIPAIPSSEKIVMAAKVLFSCAASFTRISLICFYYRLIGDVKRRVFRWILHLAMFYVIGIFISFVFLSIFQCTPVKAYWIFPASGKCLDEGTVTLVAGIVNCTADLLVTILPIPMVMRLNLPMKQRVAVVILLSLGFIVTVAGIVRTYFIWRALVDTYDESWYGYPLWICAAVEIDLGLLCACAPTLRQFLSTRFPNLNHSVRLSEGYATETGSKSSVTFVSGHAETSRPRSEALLSINSDGKVGLPSGFGMKYERPWAVPSGYEYEEHEMVDSHTDAEKGYATRITEETLREDELRQQQRHKRPGDRQPRLHDPELDRQMRESAEMDRRQRRSVRNVVQKAAQGFAYMPSPSSDLSWFDDGTRRKGFTTTRIAEHEDELALNQQRLQGDSDTIMSAEDVSSMISTGQWPLQVPVHGSVDGVQHHATTQGTRTPSSIRSPTGEGVRDPGVGKRRI